MTYHSSDRARMNQLELILENIRGSAFFSSADQCYLTAVKCSKCGNTFHEDLQIAEAKAVSNVQLECIRCDEEAQITRSGNITIAGFYATNQ